MAHNFWQKKFGFILEEEVWHTAWTTTKETRLRVLQWNISHNIYPTNIILNKINVRESHNCTFCSVTIDYFEHLFCECPIVANFWKSIQQKLYNETGLRVELSVQTIWGGGGGGGGGFKTAHLLDSKYITLIISFGSKDVYQYLQENRNSQQSKY